MIGTGAAVHLAAGLEVATDDELAQQALQDSEAFAALYRRYARRVYNYLVGKVGQPPDAEDLTAQVFLEVVESLPRYRPQGHFAAWLFTIARRQAAGWLRKQRSWLPIEAAEGQAGLPDPLKGLVQGEEVARLRARLQALPADEVELLRLRYAAGLSHAQVARVVGKSEAAVRVSLHRLLRRIEAEWEAENG